MDEHTGWSAFGDELPDEAPGSGGYARLTLVVCDHAPLLAWSRLARAVFDVVQASGGHAPGRLWGALVLPEIVCVIVGPGDATALDKYVTPLKAWAAERVLAIIRQSDDDTLDTVLRYSPVWGGAIYRVWQAGYHAKVLWTEGQLSNALYALAQRPVEAGLARSPDEWPWLWIG